MTAIWGGGNQASHVWGLMVALSLHGAAGVVLVYAKPGSWSRPPPTSVELEVIETPPPTPVVAEPEPLVPEPPPPPRPVARRRPPKPPPEMPPPATPPPSAEPPPESAPPTFGVSLDSVVTGESAVVVPVGSTLATPNRNRKQAETPAAPADQGPPSFSPVSDTYIGELPRFSGVQTREYSFEAQRLRVEGDVLLRVGVDRKGKIRVVRVIKGLGHGLDEIAVKTMWRAKVQAVARTKDGHAVDYQLTYKFKFTLGGQ